MSTTNTPYDPQIKMTFWQQVAEQSKIPRVNWKAILGQTLTSAIEGYYKDGCDQEQIYYFIKQRVEKVTVFTPMMDKNLKIGISARLTKLKHYQWWLK